MRLMQTTAALVAAVLFCAPVAHAGPTCTPTYPRGYHLPHVTKKHPLDVCVNGDLQSTWGHCVSRFSA